MGSPATPPPPQQHRPARKFPGTRSWLILEDSSGGNPHVEELGKHAIKRRTGLPTRDLRILDPLLSYPSTILGRERAIVIRLEHIKAVVTAHDVLVQNPRDPLVASFVRDLTLHLASASGAPGASAPSSVRVLQSNVDGNAANATTTSTAAISPHPMGSSPTNLDAKDGGGSALPFEFKVLEASLKYACRYLESEASTLEQEAYPAMDALTSKISTLQLERVRQIKSRLVQVSGRVQKVRDELENLLDDDMDMAEMYLTEKLSRQHEVDEEVCMDSDCEVAGEPDEGDENLTSKGRESVRSFNYTPNIQDLEVLLEAYFVQIEGTLNKLSALREYVDDTEDYINIMLDDKQNQMLQMAVMLSTANMLVNAGVAVVSTFGMNIHIDLYDAAVSPSKFWETTIGVVVSIVVLLVVTFIWGKKKGLLSS